MLEKECEFNHLSEGTNLVMGVSCGSEGIIPCHGGCYNDCCISDSDGVLCEGYKEHSEVTETVTGTKVYIVSCQNEIEYNL